MSLMAVLVLLTFIGSNLQAVLWQSSSWLVSTVLPAVVVQLTNEERATNHAAPLQRSATLDAAAKLKAEDMAKNEYFSHFSPTGVSPWHWFDEAGYIYAYAGENLAIHFTDSSEVVEAWMNSPTHRENIVNGVYTEIGVGTAKGTYEGYDTVYVVQLFGTPAVPPPAPMPASPTPVFEPEPVPAPVIVTADPAESPSLPVAVLNDIVLDVATGSALALGDNVVSLPTDTKSDAMSEAPLAVAGETKAELAPETASSRAESMTVTNAGDVVVIETLVIATSSGLAIANITTPNEPHAGATAVSLATQPNQLLQIMYFILGVVVLTLLGTSIVMEARRLRFVQVAYGVLLLLGMGGLWFINSLLTGGAVII